MNAALSVFLMDQRNEAGFGQLRLAPVADGDFRRAFQINAAVVGRERMCRQVLNLAARLHAADA